MTSKPIVHYWKGMDGRAGPMRLAFFINGVDFDNVTVEKKDWMTAREKYPTKVVPVLEIDGKMYPQSVAQMQYAASAGKGSLKTKTAVEELHATGICITLDEWLDKVFAHYKEQDATLKAKMEERSVKEVIPASLKVLETLVSYEKPVSGFVHEQMTYVDLSLYNYVTAIIHALGVSADDVGKTAPRLFQVYTTVSKLPVVDEYNKSKYANA